MLTYIENICSIQKERIALEVNISRRDVWFLIVCLGLGFLAEYSFLHGIVGVSYPIFLAGFYIVVFLRFKYSFHHRRIGLLLMVCIWIDRKSTRLNSSHVAISYAVFCLKKKKTY